MNRVRVIVELETELYEPLLMPRNCEPWPMKAKRMFNFLFGRFIYAPIL